MVKSCCAYGCKNVWKPNQGIQYHRFPLKSPALLDLWIKACRLKNITPKAHTLICSQHFNEEDYSESTLTKKRLKPDAVPSLFNVPTDYQPQNEKYLKLEHVYETKVPDYRIKVEAVASTQTHKSTQTYPRKVCVASRHKSTQTYPRKVKDPEITRKNGTIKVLQQRLRRRNMRIRTLKDMIKLLGENSKLSCGKHTSKYL